MPDKADVITFIFGQRRLAFAYHLREKQDLNFVNWLRSERCNEPKTCLYIHHPTITFSILLLSFTACSKGQVLSSSPRPPSPHLPIPPIPKKFPLPTKLSQISGYIKCEQMHGNDREICG